MVVGDLKKRRSCHIAKGFSETNSMRTKNCRSITQQVYSQRQCLGSKELAFGHENILGAMATSLVSIKIMRRDFFAA